MRKRSSHLAATSLCLLGLLLAEAAQAADGAPAPALEPTLLDVTINGRAMDEPLLLLRDGSGALYASETRLREWRIRIPATAPVLVEGEPHYRIDGLPELRTTFSAAEQSLIIEARPELFDRQVADLAAGQDIEMTPAASGGFMNYDVFAEYFRGGINFNGALEAGAFTPRGVLSSGFILRAGDGRQRVVRLDTNWTIDRPDSLSSIRIGDAVAAAGQGASPFRFAGLQFARNFAVRPGFVTMPLPVAEGSAAVPSVVDINVNNALQGSREVMPGPFELSNVPVQSGGGTVQLVTRDLLGRQVVTEQSYYASSVLLRRGLHDFSYELGLVREGFGSRSMGYGTAVASTSHRYGVSDNLTLEAHGQASRRTQLAGAGANIAVFDIGTASASAAVSRSERGTGAFVSGGFERRSDGLSLGLRADYTTASFAFIGIGEENRPARLSAQAFADMPLFGGSVGFNVLHRDRRDAEDESLAGLFANLRMMDGANVQIFARRAVAGEGRTVLGAHVAFALGGRRSAAANVEYRAGSFSHAFSYQDDAPAGIGSGYRASASLSGGRRSMESVYTYNAAPASMSAHVSHAGGGTGVRLSARGALGLIGGRPFASRALGASFAEVQVGRHAGIRVYADNQLVGVTDRSGSTVVPSLRAFDRNTIRIDEGDLPLDVQIAETELAVRPFARSGSIVRFALRRERGVLMQVRLEDGTALPAGATVRIADRPELFLAASGGEIYMPALEGVATIEASWGGERCTFEVTVPETNDPQPRIDGLVCRAAPAYAAR